MHETCAFTRCLLVCRCLCLCVSSSLLVSSSCMMMMFTNPYLPSTITHRQSHVRCHAEYDAPLWHPLQPFVVPVHAKSCCIVWIIETNLLDHQCPSACVHSVVPVRSQRVRVVVLVAGVAVVGMMMTMLDKSMMLYCHFGQAMLLLPLVS